MRVDREVMQKVLDELKKRTHPCDPRELFGAVGGDRLMAQEALSVLIDQGYAEPTLDLKVRICTPPKRELE